MWRRACAGLIVAAASVLLVAAPAGAKFWEFELELASREVVAGDVLHMEATVADWAVEQAASNPRVLPMVEVFRTTDLPAWGELGEDIAPVQRVQWEHIGEGRYRGEVTLSQPGSYEILSMRIWNRDVDGYPQPISLTVTAPQEPNVAAPSESCLLYTSPSPRD